MVETDINNNIINLNLRMGNKNIKLNTGTKIK